MILRALCISVVAVIDHDYPDSHCILFLNNVPILIFQIFAQEFVVCACHFIFYQIGLISYCKCSFPVSIVFVFDIFLDASTHLYMKVCPSVRGPSVRWSIARYFQIAEIDRKQHRIIGKVETLFLDCNNLQKTFKTNFKTKF